MNTKYTIFSKNLSLNIKYIIKKPFIFSKLILVTILPVLLGVFMVPFYTCSSFIFEIPIIFIVSIIFSSINYDWKKSTLYKNYLISNNNKYVYYLSLFSTIIIFSFLMINLLLLILFILSKLNLLIGKWFMLPDDGSYSYNFKLLSFGSLYFSYIWIVTLVFFFHIFSIHYLVTKDLIIYLFL